MVKPRAKGVAMLEFLFLILLVCYIAAWYLGMQIVADAARRKGYADITGKLWFIGFFGLIVTPAVIVAALPDKSAAPGDRAPEDVAGELPEL